MGVLLVPAGVYNFQGTVSVLPGVNISIIGLAQDGVWGSVIQPKNPPSGSNPTFPLFSIEADSIEISHLTFLGQSFAQDAVVLGSVSSQTNDTHINWCWFNGVSNAIHLINYSGGDFSHNTFDVVNYGIYSDQANGDVRATGMIANDVRGYNAQHSVIHIAGTDVGTHPDDFANNAFSGFFDHSANTHEPAVFLWSVVNNRVTGTFAHNAGDDIYVYGSQSINIGPFNTFSSGSAVVRVDQSNNVLISNGTVYNANTGNVSGTTAVISITGSHQTTISSVSAINVGSSSVPNYGLSVDAASSGTVLNGNSFTGQSTSAYKVDDTTAIIASFVPFNSH